MSLVPVPENVGPLDPRVERLFSRLQYAQRTPEWYVVRRGLITASEAAAALGIKPFAGFKGSPREELMNTKLNKPRNLTGMAMQHGIHHEAEACEFAMKLLGKTNLEFGLLVHPRFPWLAASPDGITTDGCCVEIKCPLRRKIIPGVVPHHYMPQIQVQMEVCDLEETLFIQYKPGHMTEDGTQFVDIATIRRDRDWFERHRSELQKFWEEMTERRKHHVPQDSSDDENTLDIDDDLYLVEKEYTRMFDDDCVVPCAIEDDIYNDSKEYIRDYPEEICVK